jgi:hypothetical protein
VRLHQAAEAFFGGAPGEVLAALWFSSDPTLKRKKVNLQLFLYVRIKI